MLSLPQDSVKSLLEQHSNRSQLEQCSNRILLEQCSNRSSLEQCSNRSLLEIKRIRIQSFAYLYISLLLSCTLLCLALISLLELILFFLIVWHLELVCLRIVWLYEFRVRTASRISSVVDWTLSIQLILSNFTLTSNLLVSLQV